MTIFVNSFASLLQSVMMIFIIAFVAGVMIRKKIIAQEHIRGLSIITINVLLPSLIFSKITGNLEPSEFHIWWIVPLIAMATTGIGLSIAWLVFRKQLPEKRNLLPLSSLMNAAYLILPIGKVIYPDQFDEFALYVSLYVLGISPLIWTIGKLFITPRQNGKLQLKELMTAPLWANILGLLFVLTGLRKFLPDFLTGSIELMGDATVPIATLILGATLGTLPWKFKPVIKDLSWVAIIKLVVVPGVVFLLLQGSALATDYPLLCKLLILEASAPAATALIIQIRRYGGDQDKAGTIMLFSYLLCLILIPFWLALWTSING